MSSTAPEPRDDTMGALSQPRLYPLPTGIDLTGKVAVITGASSGMGFESTRQLLTLRIATVILAVRNTTKGEECKARLLADPSVQRNNPDAVVKIMKLDVGDFTSTAAFADALIAEVPIIDIVILSAGIGGLKFKASPTGHESTVQVNYLSNVLLFAKILPHLEASYDKSGRQVHVSWVGSRRYFNTPTWAKNPPATNILQYLDDPQNFSMAKYGDSKTLCAMFMYELAPRLNSEKILFNMMCPGMVITEMGSDLSLPVRAMLGIIRAIKGRPVEQGGWVILNSAIVAGPESHGQFLVDKTITKKSEYVETEAGKKFARQLWNESLEEVSKYTALAPPFTKIS